MEGGCGSRLSPAPFKGGEPCREHSDLQTEYIGTCDDDDALSIVLATTFDAT